MAQYIHFTDEQKQRAAEVDLEEFLRQRGEKLLPSGRDKRLDRDHSVSVEMRSALSGGFIITVTQKPSKHFWVVSRVQYTHLLLSGRSHHKNRLNFLKRIPICGAFLPT